MTFSLTHFFFSSFIPEFKMQQNLIVLALSVTLVATCVLAAPGFRVKRDDASLDDIELNPVAFEVC